MTFDLNLLEDAGIDTKTGLEYTGNKDKYISALQRFYKSSEKNKGRIEECLKGEDLDDLMITVHALKSNAKMIGASTLSDMFAGLEKASREGDSGFINDNIGKALKEYERILEVLKPLGEMEDLKAEDELTAEEARKTADELLAALDDFADDLSAKLIKKLLGYPFRITQREKLKDAADLINDFMYDDAACIIKEITVNIE